MCLSVSVIFGNKKNGKTLFQTVKQNPLHRIHNQIKAFGNQLIGKAAKIQVVSHQLLHNRHIDNENPTAAV